MLASSSAGSTSAALCSCYRCREQKLKCSREMPTCARCKRMGTGCSYPDPPDRKKIARTRARPRRRQLEEDGTSVASNSKAPSRNVASTDRQVAASESGSVQDFDQSIPQLPPFVPSGDINLLQQTQFNDSTLNQGLSLHDIIPKQIRDLLEEIYFTHIFNSSLILHQGRFKRSQEAGQLPNFLALSLYALASNFLDPPCKLAMQYIQDIQALGDIALLGRQCAEVASLECLQTVDQPTLAHIQACQILALYWGSRGETSRNSMFSGIAYRAIRIRMLDSNRDDGLDWLDKEIQRRCFWAAFTTNCVNADHYIIGSSNDTLILQIPLPISEPSFSHMIQESQVSLTDFDGTKRPTSRGGEPNMWSEVLKLILHWTKIRDYIELANRSRLKDPVVRFLELEDWMSDFFDNLDVSLTYSKEKLQSQANDRRWVSFFLLHSIYHQLRLVLHTSIVPQFSGQDIPNAISPSMITTSSQIVIASAQAISRLAGDVLTLDIDVSRLSPFTGHCMYVAACVHVSLLATDGLKRFQAWNDIIPACRILKGMSPYWMVLQGLWSKISALFSSQINKVRQSTDSDAATASSPISEKHTAMIKRKAEGLSEPLAASLLQFSLRKNKKGISTDHDLSNARQLEDLLSTSASPAGPSDMISSVESIPSQNMEYGVETDMSSLGSAPVMDAGDLAFLQSINGTKDWFSDLDALDPNILANIDFTGELNSL